VESDQARPDASATLTAGLVLTVTLVGFEALAVATATPAIHAAFPGGGAYGYVLAAFMAGNLVGTVVAGPVADRRGALGPYVAAMALFAGGLAIAALSPTLGVLVAARAVQGVGGGGLMALGYAIIGRAFPPERRSRVFALLSTAWLVPAVVGPVVAAIVTERFGFRAVFGGLVPLAAIALALTAPALARALPPPADAAREEPAPEAWPPALRGALVVRALQASAYFALDAFVPPLVHDVIGGSHARTGVALTVMALAWAGAAWIADRRLAARGPRALVARSFALVLAGGALLLAATRAPGGFAIALLGGAVAAFGMGLGYGPVSVVLLAHAPRGREGRASSAMTLVETVCVAVVFAAGGAVLDALGDGREATGVAAIFAASIAIAVAGLAIAPRARALRDASA
jgi:MFS family permease